MVDIRTGKQMTRGGFLKGILASGIAPSITLSAVSLAGSANASVGRGMMRGVGARQAVMGGEKKPYDREVSYLENISGGQDEHGSGQYLIGSYIDLGIHPDSSSIARVKFSRPNSGYYCCIFGAYDSNTKNFGLVMNDNTAYVMLGYQSSKKVSLRDVNDATLDNTSRRLIFNGIVFNISHYLKNQSSLSIYMFNDNSVGEGMTGYNLSYNFKGKIYSFEYQSNTERVNLIPVVKTYNGVKEGCMYDTVSNRFFRNVGTGAFTWG